MATRKKLMAMHEAGEISRETLDCLSETIEQDIAVAKREVEKLIISVPGPIALSRTSYKRELEVISKVLNLAELRIHVLGFLSAKDLFLNVQLVCRSFRDTVQDASLNRQLYRAPENPQFPPARLPYQLQGVRNARVSTHCIVTVPSKITDAAKQSEILRNTFICQPPQLLLKLEPTFNPRHDISRKLRKAVLHNPDGLKYGDIFDGIDKMEKMGLIKEFKEVAMMKGSEKLLWSIYGFPQGQNISFGVPQKSFGA